MNRPAKLPEFGTVVFLISPQAVSEMASLELDALHLRLAELVAPVLEHYRRHGKTVALLPVVSSFNSATTPLRPRGSFALAQALGLEASLWLASGIGGAAGPAHAAAQAAISCAQAAGDVDDEVRDRFLAEQFLNAAVAIKAVGEIETSIEACAEASKYLDSVQVSIPLLRQWALMEQDRSLMDRILDLSLSEKGVSPKERYRSIKRAFEFSLNRRDRAASEPLLRQTLTEFAKAGNELDYISLVSLWKNIGQYVALQGDAVRALRILAATHQLAEEAGFSGQTRQIQGLVLKINDGQAPQLDSYRLSGESRIRKEQEPT